MTPQRNTGAGAEAELPEYAGHYRLESCLGSGGMGVVHLARSTSGLKLAVKVVHAEYAKDREFRGRFRQEVAAARKVSGAFTAPVVDADPEAARPWMATLFIPGPTLSEHVKRNGPMPPAQLRRLMAGLAEALGDIHRVGVVHRDLKPSNVLLAEDGPKVIDFGISRPKDSELRTETGKLIGTPPFMAPEQFRRPREVGPAADIFALGSVLVHAATGRGPFDSDSPYVVAYQVVHDEPDITEVPEEIAPLVLRCLAKEPEDRPTPDELMRELRSLSASYDTQAFIPAQRTTVTGETGGARGTSDPDPTNVKAKAKEQEPGHPRGPRLSRRVVLATGAVVLALGTVAALALWAAGNGPRPQESSPRTTAAAFAAWQANPITKDVTTPQCADGDGKLFCTEASVAFALNPVTGAVLWRHSVANAHWNRPPAYSGRLVQLITDEGHVSALDPDSGRSRWQRDLPANVGMKYAGDMLLLAQAGGTVTGVDSATGRTEWSRPTEGHSTPRISLFPSDPSSAYVTSTSDDGASTRVTAVDPATGDVRWETRLQGLLTPVGGRDGAVFLLVADPEYGDTTAVVRYTPGSGAIRRAKLPVPRADAQAGVRGGVVYVLSATGSLDAVDMDAGKRVWHLETSVSRGSAPVADNRHVYFSAADGRLMAVDAASGKAAGQTSSRFGSGTGGVATSVPAPLIAGTHIYATAPDGTVFAVDAQDPAGW
ncbi:serine/threonine-protein kinase [Streptomyces fuscichromogenes]|uniref:Serine/threonine protein kinase n=1 Tax=Streptomyces fuscichromogenes TaxID=1324013 RepID=A0A917XBK1_9ACTN|nr:serine/threonine-protein kinase [Streptomyces fuscichromogenes]GGN05345.1 serine/threonine protein kinase [Streptomyces fuscichromogenes]